MRATSTFARTAVFAVLFLLAGLPAHAQSPGIVEFSGGYQFLFDMPENFNEESGAFTTGFFASAAWNVTRRLGFVYEFSRSAKVLPLEDNVGSFADGEATVYGNLGGARFRFGSFFVQALLGQVALQKKEELLLGVSDSTVTDLALQPGAGVDLQITERVAARIQGDYRHFLGSDDDFGKQFRFAAGVVVGLWAR